MTQDRILKIVSSIVRTIVSSGETDLAEDELVRRLTDEGYRPAEIQNAFGVLTKVVENLSAEARNDVRALETGYRRTLTEKESIRMTEDAIHLYRDWHALNLMTLTESEEILRQVLQSHAGEVDAVDLFHYAENAAIQGSSLSLYLSAHHTTRQ